MKIADFLTSTYLPHIQRHLKPRSIAETTRILNRYVIPKFGDWNVSQLAYSDVLALHASLRRTPIQANCVVAALSGLYRLALKMGEASLNPCRDIPFYRTRNRERYLSAVEAAALIAHLKDDDAGRLIRLLIYTGARPSEWQTAEWRWISTNMLRLPDSKRGPRTIYLPPKAVEILKAMNPSYPNGVGRIFKTRVDLRRGFAKAAKAAGIENVRPYDLRHTFASNALAAGCSLAEIGLTLGHRKPETTMRYAHLSPETGIGVAQKASERITA